MDTLHTIYENGQFVLLTLLGLLLGALLISLVRPDPEQAVRYDVEIPDQCKPGWKGEELDRPSLKVLQDYVGLSPSN